MSNDTYFTKLQNIISQLEAKQSSLKTMDYKLKTLIADLSALRDMPLINKEEKIKIFLNKVSIEINKFLS